MLEQFDLTDATARLIASDWLLERGRNAEAELLRSKSPVRLVDGIVRPNWDREAICAMMNTNPNAVYRALERLYARQTADEQQSEDTRHLNGRGFNARDAQFGSSLAMQVINWRAGNSQYRQPLSANQLASARRMLKKYAAQLARAANGED